MHFERIHLELTNQCNFGCEFCPDRLITRPRGNMDPKLMRRVLHQIADDGLTRVVCLHLMGEPLLHPNLLEAVQLAGRLGLEVHLTTNGWLLTDELMGDLLKADLHTLIVSVQTPDPKSFTLRQARIGFEEYRRRVTSALARSLEADHRCQVVLSLLVTPFKRFLLPSRVMSIIDTRAELARHAIEWLADTTEQCGREEVGAQFNDRREELQRRLGRLKLLARNRVPITRTLSLETRPLGDWVRPDFRDEELKAAHWGCCEGLTEQVGILWNGDLVYCCVDYDGDTAFGNINEITIREAFHQENVRQALQDFRNLRIRHPRCRKCMGDTSLPRSLGRQLGSIIYFKLFKPFQGRAVKSPAPLIDV